MRKALLLLVLLLVLPLVNIQLAKLFLDKTFIEPLLDQWLRGFAMLVLELLVITLPGIIPLLGPVYLAWLGKHLGFRDKAVEKALQWPQD